MRFPALTPTAWPDNERFMVRKSNSRTDSLRRLLRKHLLHESVYLRVAKRLGVDPSYVSKVASGKVPSLKIRRALVEELQRIERM
jgi:transcriptional regulator with XRE-family HTH domain